MSTEITPGQRWLSESEPELGLGLIVEVDARQIAVLFPASEVERRYTRKNAPLRRVQFRTGDAIENRDGLRLTIERVEQQQGLFVYYGQGHRIAEVELDDRMRFDSPEDRLNAGQWDEPGLFALRRDVLQWHSRWCRLPVRGFLGGRVELLPWQQYIASTIASRPAPRVLLADETGLGKTIEACLLLHHLLVTERIHRVLILLPEPLVHQWFVELIRRFQLVFQIVDSAHCEALGDPEANPFTEDQQLLCSLPWLMAHPDRIAQVFAEDWDLVLLDEAHHIKAETPTYEFVEALTRRSWGALLLTATPEQRGVESHFARLKLLDPDRYTDFSSYQEHADGYHAAAKIAGHLLDGSEAPAALLGALQDDQLRRQIEEARQESPDAQVSRPLLQALLDRYGPGRAMFRNTRQQIQGFPQRQVQLQPLAADDSDDPRLHWLHEFLASMPAEKVLLMAHSRQTIHQIDGFLQSRMSIDTALFHEGLSLLQRDRQAAWFQSPQGARLMLCSSIGGEGRNFQSARHLVFFDLPRDPEILEQHIGRLDRIGQGDRIFLHVPYLEGSEQELWAQWYHRGLDAFAHNFPGGYHAKERFAQRLLDLQRGAFDEGKLQALLDDTRRFRQQYLQRVAAGRDRLLELGSFDKEAGEALCEAIEAEEQNPQTHDLCMRLFSHFGVDIEPHTEDTWVLQPTPRLHEGFPWLKGEMMRVTFDRQEALQHAATVFLSLDHPMWLNTTELLLSSPEGSCSAAIWDEAPEPTIVLECLFVVQCVAPVRLDIARFLPPTPLRVAFDHRGNDATQSHPAARFEGALSEASAPQLLENRPLFEQLIPQLLEASRAKAAALLEDVVEAALDAAEETYQPELDRLHALRPHNPAISQSDIDLLRDFYSSILDHIQQAQLRLDALRLIVGF